MDYHLYGEHKITYIVKGLFSLVRAKAKTTCADDHEVRCCSLVLFAVLKVFLTKDAKAHLPLASENMHLKKPD